MRLDMKRIRVALLTSVVSGVLCTPAFAQSCEVKMGVSGPMSGGAAAWGLAAKSAAEFVAALTNEEGGLKVGDKKCMVKIISQDALYTAAGGAAAANFLASEGVHAAVGPVGAPEVTGYKPVAARNGLLGFTSTYAADAVSPDTPLMFKALQSPPTFGPEIIKAAKARFGHKSIVVIGANDQGGTDGSKALAKMYAAEGFKTYEEYYQRGTTNFAPIATRVMTFDADSIEVGTMPPVDQTILFKQLVEAGFKGVVGSLGGGGEKPIVEGLGGGKSVRGAYWLETMDTEQPGAVKLAQEYKRLMKTDPPVNALFLVFTNASELMLAAVSKAGTDQDGNKIAEALRTTQPVSRFFGKEGWRGKTQFKVNQELAFPVGMGVYQDGKRVGVSSVSIPTE